jgi:hypothetical protein
MFTLARVIAALFAIPPMAYAVWRAPSLFSYQGFSRGDWFLLPMILFPLSIGALLLWFALTGSRQGQLRRIGFALLGGGVIGAVAFAAGFLGPIVLRPDSNQGPLFGLIFSGPLGFVLGCLAGAVWPAKRPGPQHTAPEAPTTSSA